MSTPDPPSAPNDPPPPSPSPGPSAKSRGAFGKLFQNIRVASRSVRASPKLREKVVDLAKTLTKLAGEAAGDAGVPGLAIGVGVLDEVLGKIQTMSDNIEDAGSLKERIEKLKTDMTTLKSLPSNQALPEDAQHSLEKLMNTWAAIGESAQHIAERGRFKRFVGSSADADKLEDLVAQIKTSIDDFMLHEVLVGRRDVHQMHQTVKAMAAILEDSFIPRFAKRAQYNASNAGSARRACLPDTRVDILGILRVWILASVAEGAALDAQHGIVFWISGLAGTGKTTIAYSIAQWCKEQGILGGSFFCSRLDAECRDPSFIFVTLCRQLCQFHTPFKEKVTEAMRKDPSIIHASPSEQFEKLILEPLEALKEAMPKAVIVIDALDECQDQEATSTTLNVLAKFVPRIAQATRRSLLIIATSRPEPHVAAVFKESREETLSHTTTRLLLHMYELISVRDDIKRCIKNEFTQRQGTVEVEKGWPSQRHIDTLADLSGRLFIFATTAVKFIMSPYVGGTPGERMNAIIHSGLAPRTPEDLSTLYVQIAQAASATFLSPSNSLGPILGTIALAREPLSSTLLGDILGRRPIDVRGTLSGLHSVLHIPDDYNEAIQVIHPTFAEFLLATDLAKPEEFRINAADQHAFLFEQNLQIMKALKHNIVGFPSHLLAKDKVPTLKADIERCIPLRFSYAVRHWTAHLDGATSSSALAEARSAFNDFVRGRLLFWLEARSLLGVLDTAVTELTVVCIACRKSGGAFAALIPLLSDSRRFAVAYYAAIDIAPLQLYQAALAFAPDRSLVKQVYRKELQGVPIARRGVAPDWEPCIKAINVDVNEGATWVDFSPDRSIYVDDDSRICNVTTQKVLTTLDLRGNGVICAAFCPDGQHVATVPVGQRKTLDVWHLTSGEREHSFEGHSNVIRFVTYSADGRNLLSADGHEVRLWSVSDRQSLLALPWDLALPWGIALSPYGSVIALPDPADDRLCLYSTASQTSERLPLSGRMRTAAFSLDGRYVATSTNTTITIWTLAERSVAHSLDVPAEPYRLAFSTDSTRLGCGLHDGSVYLWQITSPGPPVVLCGHANSVDNVIWSLDDSQIISVSYDDTVRIWDATQSPVADEQPQLPTDIISLPDSPCPTVLCKLEDNLYIFHLPGPAPLEPFRTPDNAPTMTLHANIAEAWDAALSTESSRLPDAAELTCARDWELLTGQRHIFPSYPPVTLSQDATLMAFSAPSDDKMVRVCNLRTGNAVAALSCHNPVRSTAFSPDGSLLATGSDDHQVCVWDIATQQLVNSHTTHTNYVLAVAFSHGGQLVASGGRDGVVCLYALAERRTLHTLTFRGLVPWVMRVAFSADDAHVIALDNEHHTLIGDVATGAIIHHVSLSTDVWTRTLDFAPDHAGLLIHAKNGRVHKVNMGQTEPCIWPVYHVSVDGWVTEKRPGRRARRVCWLPPEWRIVFSLGGSFFCTVDRDRRWIVVIDVSEVEGLEVDSSLVAKMDLAS